ncbi:hypothetical protein PMAYCL1PPCAC_14949, partial [Pristionchus mayeri]
VGCRRKVGGDLWKCGHAYTSGRRLDRCIRITSGCPNVESLYTHLPYVTSFDSSIQVTYARGLSVIVNADYDISQQDAPLMVTVNDDKQK